MEFWQKMYYFFLCIKIEFKWFVEFIPEGFFEKGQRLRPFSGLSPSKLKILSKNVRVGYVYIEG